MSERIAGQGIPAGGTSPDANGPRPNVWGWVGGMLADPRSTYEGIAGRLFLPHPSDRDKTVDGTKWWLPVLIVIVVAVGVALYTVPNIVMPGQTDAIRASVVERGGSADQADEAIRMARAVGVPAGVVGAAVATVAILFITAAVVHGLALLFGGKGKFRTARAVVAWSMIVSALGSLIKLPLMVAKKTMFVETSPTLFFKQLEPTDRLYRFLSGFDIFTLWWVVLIGLGLVICYSLSKAKAGVVAFILWLLTVGLTMLAPGGGGFGVSR